MCKSKIPIEALNPPEILSKEDSFPDFCCGERDIDEFIHEEAHIYQKQSLGITYIFKYSTRLIGFATISMADIRKSKMEKEDRLPKPIPNYPALLIGQLAVCEDQQRGDIGTYICKFCIDKAVKLSKIVGCRFVVVNAIAKEKVISFYEKLGFILLPKQEDRKQKIMILSILNQDTVP